MDNFLKIFNTVTVLFACVSADSFQGLRIAFCYAI